MADTPEVVLHRLAKRLDADRPRVDLMRRYSDGDAPLPEMGANTRSTWEKFQKRARTNMGGVACASLGGRMIPLGVTVGGTSNPVATVVWRDNRLGQVFADAIWDVLATGRAYIVGGLRDGEPIITAEKPELMIADPDPAQPWRTRAALKAWRDLEAGRDYAIVWMPGQRQRFVRPSRTLEGATMKVVAGDNWERDGDVEEFDGPLPVWAIENRHGKAEFEDHTDTIDRINLGKLQRLVTTAMQAFKQRAIKGGLPEKDENGNDIDYSRVFEHAPGALWDLPEGIDIWESAETDIRPLLEGEKTDMRDFAGELRTPLSAFIPDAENQSAEGAANSKEGEIQKAKDRIRRARGPMEAALVWALEMLGEDSSSTVEVLFEPPEHVSFNEKTSAAASAKAAGMSQRWVNRNIMGMSPEEIERDIADRLDEQLQQSLAFTEAMPQPTPAPQQAPALAE